MTEKQVLYQDRSGVFGCWYLIGKSEWSFKPEMDVDLSERDMKYLLSELDRIKK